MLCDEPTSALDAETTREVLSTLAAVNRNLGVTLVIVTHELSVVLNLCQRVAVMQQGQLVEQFATSEAAHGQTALARELAALAAVHAAAPAPATAGAVVPLRPSAAAGPRADTHAPAEVRHA